ncbi:MAG TPA: hypothetical protein VHX65_13600 [Pirellulales bacterium]|nr:hypothetical protein [Pirellulales bacterium]
MRQESSERNSCHAGLAFGLPRHSAIRPAAIMALLVGWLAILAGSALAADSADEFTKDPTWTQPTAKAVRADVLKWLDDAKIDGKKIDAAKRDSIVKSLWPESPAPAAGEMLERVVKTIAEVEPRSKPLLELCSKPHEIKKLPDFPLLTDDKTPAIVRNNLRLWYGRWLAQEKLYDEALEQLSTLKTTDVVDPASLLFYQGVTYHWLLKKQPGLQAIGKLLERKNEIPRRYAELASLMQTDLSALKDESLDHIDRRMHDVENRLDLARAGKKVRTEEDGIIASLDKLIEQKEKEQEEQESASSSGNPNGHQSRSPAQDSMLPHGPPAKGEVAKKDIGNHSGWGDLKPKERAEALQDIGEEFPSHYRNVIEQYFRRVAGDNPGSNDPGSNDPGDAIPADSGSGR